MSDDFVDKLEGLIHEHRQTQAAVERDEQTEARFSALEKKFDDLGNLISERLPEKTPQQPNSEGSAGKKGEESGVAADNPPPSISDKEEEEDLQIERVKKFSVPRIYTGDDEPSTVKYIDADTGETMERKGRRKNHPTNYDVETVVEELPVDRPQEPGEDAA